MKLLADHPSLEFLRREAKDRLEALRAVDPIVTLADAQQRTAEDYGFRSWNELRDEVARRRASVPEPPAGLAEAVAAAFGVGTVVAPMTPLRYEYMGRRWALETDRGRFQLCPVFDWISDATAEVAVDLQERARAAGVRSPRPVRSADGGLVRRVRDQNWRLDEWMDLGPTPVEPITAPVARRVGAALASIHSVAPGTDLPVEGQWVSPRQRPTPDQWASLHDRACAAGCDWAPALARLAPTITELSGVTAEADQAQVVITNRDLVPDAVRIADGGELVFLHWDFAGPMLPEWELATTLMHWSGSGTNTAAAHALLSAYRDAAGAAPALSVRSFGPFVTGWLTWLLHRGWEATDAEPSEKRDFSDRAVREVLSDPLSVTRLEVLCEALAPR